MNPAPSRLNSRRAAFKVPSSSFLTAVLFQAFGRAGNFLRTAALNLLSGSGRASQLPRANRYSPATQATGGVPRSRISVLGLRIKVTVIPIDNAKITNPTESRIASSQHELISSALSTLASRHSDNWGSMAYPTPQTGLEQRNPTPRSGIGNTMMTLSCVTCS